MLETLGCSSLDVFMNKVFPEVILDKEGLNFKGTTL
jgi:hypothetical protein